MKYYITLCIALITATLSYSQTYKSETETVHTISSANVQLNTQQDLYNALRTKIPSCVVLQNNQFEVPKIRVRNTDVQVVYIDGVRTNLSALQYLNPADIDTIQVIPNATTNLILP